MFSDALDRALRSLRRRQRAVLVLRYFVGGGHRRSTQLPAGYGDQFGHPRVGATRAGRLPEHDPRTKGPMSTLEEEQLRRGLRAITPTASMKTRAIAVARIHRNRRLVALAAGAVLAVGATATVAARQVPGQQGDLANPAGTATSTGTPIGSPPQTPNPARTGPEHPVVGVAYPYDLYVHCGIRHAKFGGRWWHAVPERPGQLGPYTPGTMTLVSADHARFDAADPRVTVDFQPATDVPIPCD